MQITLFSLTSFFFFTWFIRNIVYWISLWQIKEYRIDRLFIHLRETQQGQSLLFSNKNLLKIILIISYGFVLFNDNLLLIYQLCISLLMVISAVNVAQEVIEKKIKIPIFTLKTSVVFFLSFLFIGLLYLIPLLDKFFWLLFLDKLVPIIVALFIGIFSIPSTLFNDFLIHKSIQKRNIYKNLTVIGITGSYGKGSTKEFVSKILSEKFSVLKTPGTFNSPIGIAKTILSHLSAKTNIFVVEMGAYKKHEIEEMSSMVHPKIGILTGVNDQHISLFGSLENTKKAKYELIEALKKDGLALFNGNNQNSFDLAQKSKKKKIIYFADYNNSNFNNVDTRAYDIVVDKFDLSFKVAFKNDSEVLTVQKIKLIGKYNVENLLPGIYLGRHFGMTDSEITKALKKIVSLPKTMEPYLSEKKTILIDDTFNANPASVASACEYLKIYSKKKIFVLQPMIELGKNAYNDHYKCALEIGKVCDYLMLTNNNFYQAIEKGIYDSNGNCKLAVQDPRDIIKFVGQELGKDDVVVFEGKEASIPLLHIKHKKVYSD